MNAPETTKGSGKFQLFLEKVEGLTFGAALLMFVVSVSVLGWLPAQTIQEKIDRSTPDNMKDYTELEALGRRVYAREGCAYCHTQLVRRLREDILRFGPRAQGWEYQYDYPHFLGTRRIGPDLSRESGTRPDEWHYAHFYNPRYTVPQSIMPGFPWLFKKDEDGNIIPTKEARGLVAYMNYLGRAAKENALKGAENAEAGSTSTESSTR
ncbi:MAG: cbb3-type cytochrome c oxidase subunit II [Gammaproteobacteria bacterium]|jgi:cbb3-type cytochrome c oxidase subunit II